MNRRYYFDTSIWLDLFEERDESDFPKSEIALKLINSIIINDETILFSDINQKELLNIGYSEREIEYLLKNLVYLLVFIESTPKEVRRSKDLSTKRKIPQKDALHALIARDNKAILVTFDRHFQKLIDITAPHKLNDLY